MDRRKSQDGPMSKTERQRRWRQNKAAAKRRLEEAGLVEVPLILRKSELDTMKTMVGSNVGDLIFMLTRGPIEHFIRTATSSTEGEWQKEPEHELTDEDEAIVMELIRNKANATPEDRKVLEMAEQIIELSNKLDKRVRKA